MHSQLDVLQSSVSMQTLAQLCFQPYIVSDYTQCVSVDVTGVLTAVCMR